jgi:integrase
MLDATGLRRAELAHLKVNDIDSERMVSWQPLAHREKAHYQQSHLGGLPGSCYTSWIGR